MDAASPGQVRSRVRDRGQAMSVTVSEVVSKFKSVVVVRIKSEVNPGWQAKWRRW